MSNDIDRAQKEMPLAENDIVRDAKLKRKDCDLPFNQEICASGISIVSSNLVYRDSDGDSVSRCKISLAGSGVPSTSPYSTSDAGNVAEVRNYKIPNSNLGNSSITMEGLNYWRGQRHQMYQLSDGSTSRNPQCGLSDKEHMVLSSEEELRRMPFDLQDGKRLLTKQQNRDRDEVSADSAHSIDNYNKNLQSNIRPLGDNQSNVSPNFPQFLAKQYLKGKGVQSNSNKTEVSIADISQNEDQQASLGKVAFDAPLRSSAELEKCSDIGDLDSYLDGVSLREWLKVGNFEINKVERLHLFRQIVQLVDFAHLRGVALQDLRLSCFRLLPSKRVIYSGRLTQIEMSVINQNIQRKRSLEQEISLQNILGIKQQKLEVDMKFVRHQSQLSSRCGISTVAENEIDSSMTSVHNFDTECKAQNNFFSCQKTSFQAGLGPNYVTVQLEKKWYACPEKFNERGLLQSNVYSLGVLLFELLCSFDSFEVHSEAMLDLRRQILPSKFLSENSKEAGVCLFLLHPEPSSRPTTREILRSEMICGSEEFSSEDNLSPWTDKDDDAESELLLLFLNSLEEQKKKEISSLQENIACVEADIKEFEGRYVSNKPSDWTGNVCAINPRNNTNSCDVSRSFSMSNNPAGILMKNLSQLQNAYFYMRSQIQHTETAAMSRPDKNVLINHDRSSRVKIENEESSMEGKPVNCFSAFFEGICKFARYKKFDVCGTLRNGDLLNSANMICSLSFDREEDYIATAGISKKIKVFEFASLIDDSVDIHYPVVEMSNKSKLSCVCWNKYIKNYLVSTDYDGVVQMWDASTGQGFSQYTEHQNRAWSVDFSQVDPMKFASGSDDCSIKLWSINEKSSIGTICNRANVCCVQFSPYSSHLLAFGSADFKVYCYDLRHTRIPWCTLAGHGKAVSYVKFLDSETVVSASTDNTLKIWDLNKTSLEGFSSNACSSTFSGHTNEKNFVGLSVLNGYLACGSETNEVYAYYRSLPMPITSHKFGSVDPISGQETTDNNEPFVSSICWREKYNMVVAANSSGRIELLQMV